MPIRGEPTGAKCRQCRAPLIWRARKDTGVLFPGCQDACWKKAPQTPIKVPDPMTPSSPQTPSLSAPSALGDTLYQAMRASVQADIQTALATAKVAGPISIEWKVNGTEFAKLEKRAHVALGEIMRRVKANFKNILLVGPAGTGKTTLSRDLADSLKLPNASLACSSGMPEWHLVGRSLPDLTTGHSRYQVSDFIRLYENGGVFLMDEIDGADANVLISINTALANGHFPLPARVDNPVATRHKDFYLIAAANTYGRGADMQYVGRNALDAATLDRFVGAIIAIDYDEDLECSLVPEETITLKVWEIRKRAQAAKLRRVVGTRAMLAVAALVRSGESMAYALDAITMGWTIDERSKVGL